MQAKIELIRVDNRLVHGQVGVSWSVSLNIDTIVVVDDETAQNPLSQKLMQTIAKSANVQIRFYSIEGFAEVFPSPKQYTEAVHCREDDSGGKKDE